MHKLIDYICDELDSLEQKAEKDGKLTVSEIQYGDMLAHFKKNLLKAEEMEGGEYDGYSRRGMSYRYDDGFSRGRGRNARRDSRGRYTSRGYDGYSGGGDMMDELRSMMDEAQDDRSRAEIQKFINKMEQMR
jgi:hypothetical protein